MCWTNYNYARRGKHLFLYLLQDELRNSIGLSVVGRGYREEAKRFVILFHIYIRYK